MLPNVTPPEAGRAPVRVKICGLREPASVAAALDAGADWLGFNFFARSPRYVTYEQASRLAAMVPNGVGCVGLLVAPSDDEIASLLAAVPLAALQIYAPAERCVAIRNRFGMPVWQAVGVSARGDLPANCAVDRMVVESKAPPGADRPGGNGAGFDWGLLGGWTAPGPWMLAGGLRPDTVRQAILASGADAVDVASGVETAPGIKDPALIAAFVRAARAARPDQ